VEIGAKPVLELHEIQKDLGGREIVGNLSLQVNAGQVVCLTGPSGVGKTTVLEIAAGLLEPDGGRRSVATTRLGYAFQDDALIPWRSAAQNLAFVIGDHRNGHAEKIDLWLDRLGLAQAAHQLPGQISGGMRRRLNLARALCVEPKLLILDEPFAFLDGPWLERIARMLAQVTDQGTAVLLASHQMEPLAGLDCQNVHLGN
jgi:ABC-type multidrug transport system ATPase subunit